MSKRLVLILMTLMLAAQSFAAGVNVHQCNQSGQAHLEFSPDHDSEEHHASEHSGSCTGKTQHQGELDCHDCCHCYRVSSFALVLALESFSFKKSCTLIPAYAGIYPSITPDSLLRPPIRNA